MHTYMPIPRNGSSKVCKNHFRYNVIRAYTLSTTTLVYHKMQNLNSASFPDECLKRIFSPLL